MVSGSDSMRHVDHKSRGSIPDGKYFGSIRAPRNVYERVLEFVNENHGWTLREVMDAEIDISDVIQCRTAKYLTCSCPGCNGYMGIILPKPGDNTALTAINRLCLTCGYRLAWILIDRTRQRAKPTLTKRANSPVAISHLERRGIPTRPT